MTAVKMVNRRLNELRSEMAQRLSFVSLEPAHLEAFDAELCEKCSGVMDLLAAPLRVGLKIAKSPKAKKPRRAS